MKVLFFCNLIPLKTGAFETLLARIGQEFKKANDEFIVVFSGEPITPVAEKLRASGVKWHILKGWADGPGKERSWGFVLSALHLIRVERPDIAVVHFGNEIPTLVTILLSRLLGLGKIKWVWQQDQQIQDPSPLSKQLSRLSVLNLVADHFVAVYGGGCESYKKRGIPAEKISVIFNSVTSYRPTRPCHWLRQEFGIGPREIILVTVGSLIPRKRIDFILRACAQIHSGYVWRLLVIGEGPEQERLELLARESGIAERVHFVGIRNDVREILAVSDIYVHASFAETCTYAVTESMAAGIPTVMLNAGAAKEQIQQGVSGYVLESDDPSAFSARIQSLMADGEKRAEMGRQAEIRWRNYFALETSAPQYHRLYRHLGAK